MSNACESPAKGSSCGQKPVRRAAQHEQLGTSSGASRSFIKASLKSLGLRVLWFSSGRVGFDRSLQRLPLTVSCLGSGYMSERSPAKRLPKRVLGPRV